MAVRLNPQAEIEDLRHHSAETVEILRELLVCGAPAKPDPRRPNFYEVQNHSQVFYIHISPFNGKVMLLATWPKQTRPATFQASSSAS